MKNKGGFNSRKRRVAKAAPAIQNSNDFVTVWKVKAGQELTFAITGDCTIDWGMGRVATVSNSGSSISEVSNTYREAGEFEVRISSGITSWMFITHEDADDRPTDSGWDHPLRDVKQWGGAQWVDMSGMFEEAKQMQISAKDAPNLERVADMSEMFHYCSEFNSPIGHWDVSSVLEMGSMFCGATDFNQSLSGWDVSSVWKMAYMFDGAEAFNQPLNGWDVSSVQYMKGMFNDALAFNQPLNDWDVSCVWDMQVMFGGAISFNQPLYGWNVENVETTSSMFSRTGAFKQDLSGWNIDADTDTDDMFGGNTTFDTHCEEMDAKASKQAVNAALEVNNG